MPRPYPNPSQRISAFWSRVNIPSLFDCWIWQGYTLKTGYGSLKDFSGKTVLAHRFAWELTHDPIPKGMYVLHHCDNPTCVNPSHLYVGSQLNNMHDMIKRNRQVHHKGMAHPNSKLTDDNIKEIRRLLKQGVPQPVIANQFSVTSQNISSIKLNKIWTHVH